MKILVIGNAGSGKSSLGKKLTKRFRIPLYGLDQIVWEENWIPTPKEKRIKLIEEIICKDSWIIEGVSKRAFERADQIYFLDLPTHQCVFNIIKRFIHNGLGTRDGLPKNCPEYIGVFKALKICFIFNKVTRAWIAQEIAKNSFNQKIIRIGDYEHEVYK